MTNNTQINNFNNSQWISLRDRNPSIIDVLPAANDNAKRMWQQFWFIRGDEMPISVGLFKDKAHHWLEMYAEFCEDNKAEPDQEWLMG